MCNVITRENIYFFIYNYNIERERYVLLAFVTIFEIGRLVCT